MRAPTRITEADLRTAMREPRYWQDGHPERDAYRDWVRGGFQALHPRDGAARGSVWVQAYVRSGHPVAGHWRAAPPSSAGAHMSPAALDDGDIIPVSRLDFFKRLFRGPADSPGGVPRQPTPPRRWVDRDGRDRVDELRSDTGTRPSEQFRLRGGGRQWDRPGGPALRQRDLESLGPTDGGTQVREGVTRYELRDGRIALVRVSTSRSRGEPPTLDVQRPVSGTRDFVSTDKFRYRFAD